MHPLQCPSLEAVAGGGWETVGGGSSEVPIRSAIGSGHWVSRPGPPRPHAAALPPEKALRGFHGAASGAQGGAGRGGLSGSARTLGNGSLRLCGERKRCTIEHSDGFPLLAERVPAMRTPRRKAPKCQTFAEWGLFLPPILTGRAGHQLGCASRGEEEAGRL